MYHLTVFNMQATRDNRTIVLPPHVHCYIPERNPMAEFNVSYTINVLHRTAHRMLYSQPKLYLCNQLNLQHAQYTDTGHREAHRRPAVVG